MTLPTTMGTSLKVPLSSLLVAIILTGLVGVRVKTVAEAESYEIVQRAHGSVLVDRYEEQVKAFRRVAEELSLPDDLLRVAYCESNNRQFYADGSLVVGPDGHDRGRFQIRETVHREDAERMGWDIDTAEGNLAYARYLYDRSGLGPWYSSEHCWSSPVALRAKGYPGYAQLSPHDIRQ